MASRIRRVLAATLLATAGCEGTSQGGGADLDDLPLLSITEEIRLGDRDDPEIGFSSIRGVDVDRDGNVYVLENSPPHIRVYDESGERIGTIGGPGEGPGEFSAPFHFGVAGDTIWVVDVRLQRITLFDRTGDVLSTTGMESVPVLLHEPGMVYLAQPVRMWRADRFVGDLMSGMVAYRNTDPIEPGPTDTVPTPLVRFDASGDVLDTIGWKPVPPPDDSERRSVEIGPTRYGVPYPSGDGPVVAYADDGWWQIDRPRATSAEPSSIRVTRFTDGGDTVWVRGLGYTPEPYSSADLDSIAARIVAETAPDGADLDAARSAVRNLMDFPTFRLPVAWSALRGGVLGGEDGTLWLSGEDRLATSRRWTVIDREGTPIGQIEVPVSWTLRWATADRIIVVETDELGVPWLVRYRVGA